MGALVAWLRLQRKMTNRGLLLSPDARTSGVCLRLPSRRVLKAFDRRRVATKEDPHAERPLWGPHPDKAVADIEREYYRVGNDYLRALYASALGKRAPAPRAFLKAFGLPGETQVEGWGKLTELFDSRLGPDKLLEGWDIVLRRLADALLPGKTIAAAAERMALRSHLMWRLGDKMANPDPLPWASATDALGKAQVASMEWAKVHGGAYLSKLKEESKLAVREVLIASREAGEGTSGLERRLFSRVSHLNRDWRRVALTETSMAVINGQLSSAIEPGVRRVAKWVGSPMACKHCLGYAGQEFDILPGPDPARGDTAVWPGKNNVGRSAYKWSRKEVRFREPHEMYWPCSPLHPFCCCSYLISIKP